MTEHDQLVGQVLERWRFEGEVPDWEDVLARAGLVEQAQPQSWLPRRFATPRRLYAALLLAGVVAVAAPAFAIVARQLLSGHPVRGTATTTHVELGARSSADLRLRSSGSPLRRDSSGFRFSRSATDHARSFRWTLELHGLDSVAEARLAIPGRAIVLCRPCRSGGGVFVLRDGAALGLLNGRGTFTLGSASRRIAPSAGGRLPRQP
jgi:hypothetical protein